MVFITRMTERNDGDVATIAYVGCTFCTRY